MSRRGSSVIMQLALLAALLGALHDCSPALAGPATALVHVALPTREALATFEALGLPVYARLDGTFLAGADPSGVESLARSGLSFRILDSDIADIVEGRSADRLYFGFAMPGRPPPDWGSHGRILLAESDQVLVRASPADAARMSQAGARLRQIRFDPKPLRSFSVAEAFPQVSTPDPYVQSMMDQVDGSVISHYVGDLSGEWPVMVDDGWYTIPTRFTYSGTPIQKSAHYIGDYFQSLGLGVEYHQWRDATNPNVIGELRGSVKPADIYVICAHLDDVQNSPGADDNGSGCAAVMMAADILSQYEWGCTLRFALWTGEEQNLDGSDAYASRALSRGENIVGVLNLDMIGWNTPQSGPGIDLIGNNSIPASMELAQLFADVVETYNLELNPQVRSSRIADSDHYSFWQYGYTAMLGIEDEDDFNPYYHSSDDRLESMDIGYFTQFVKAAVGTFVHMSDCLNTAQGSLKVDITPPAAITAGAQWQIDGGTWHDSGVTLSGLMVGEHTLQFKSIPRWVRPYSRTVTILADLTTTATGTYKPFKPMVWPLLLLE